MDGFETQIILELTSSNKIYIRVLQLSHLPVGDSMAIAAMALARIDYAGSLQNLDHMPPITIHTFEVDWPKV